MRLIVITTNIVIYICESIFVFEDYYRKKNDGDFCFIFTNFAIIIINTKFFLNFHIFAPQNFLNSWFLSLFLRFNKNP